MPLHLYPRIGFSIYFFESFHFQPDDDESTGSLGSIPSIYFYESICASCLALFIRAKVARYNFFVCQLHATSNHVRGSTHDRTERSCSSTVLSCRTSWVTFFQEQNTREQLELSISGTLSRISTITFVRPDICVEFDNHLWKAMHRQGASKSLYDSSLTPGKANTPPSIHADTMHVVRDNVLSGKNCGVEGVGRSFRLELD